MKIKHLLLSSLATTGAIALGATAAKADTVTVKAGDTVSEIADTHKTTVAAVQKLNHLKNVNLIYVGDKLQVNKHQTVKMTRATTSVATPSTTTTTTSAAVQSPTSTVTATSTVSQSTASQASA
ncbi:MAG: LysM peptidoglycan-binding domain-containing protein, partial [Lactiplantibacillus plantarum]